MEKEVKTLGFSFGEISDEPDTVYIKIRNTGISAEHPDFKKIMERAAKTSGVVIYAAVHNIDPDNIEW